MHFQRPIMQFYDNIISLREAIGRLPSQLTYGGIDITKHEKKHIDLIMYVYYVHKFNDQITFT